MIKEITINIPDDLWVDSWTQDNTISLTYDGPEKIYVKIKHDNSVMTWSVDEIENSESNEYVIELSAEDTTDVAYYLINQGNIEDHVFQDEENHDGSIYKKIINPSIYDMFYIDCTKADGLSLKPIFKQTDTFGEIKAKEKLSYIKKYDELYDFDSETQAIIDQFILATETYLEQLASVYPWKYINLPDQSPRIPAILIEKFKSLPEGFGSNLQ